MTHLENMPQSGMEDAQLRREILHSDKRKIKQWKIERD